MDDNQFMSSSLFTDQIWREIIKNAIQDAYLITKNIIQEQNKANIIKKYIPFMKRN